MKHIGIAIFFFFFLDCSPALSQQAQIDTWLDSLNQSSLTPSDQICLHQKLSEAYNNINPSDGEKHALRTIELARSIDDIPNQADGYRLLGISHVYRGNYEKAMTNFFEALKLSEFVNDKKGIAISLKNIGGIQYSLNQYEKALEYASRGLALERELNDSSGIADGLFAKGLLESRLGNDSASMASYEQALEMYKLLGNTERQAGIYLNLSEQWFDKNDIEKALEYSRSSVILRRANGIKRGLANSLNRFAEIHLEIGNYDSVLVLLDESLEISKELDLLPQLRDNYRSRTKLDSIRKDYESAFYHFKKYTLLKDSIQRSKNKNLLTELERKYAEDKQITELLAKDAMIEKQWTIVLSVFTALLAVMIITAILYRNNSQKQKINETLAEQKTYIQKQKNQLSELNKVKDKWFSIISHDFRSPLTFLQGAMNLLNTGDLNDDETRMLTVEVEDRVNRTAILLDNLMFWAQSHLDGLQLRYEIVDIHALIEQLILKFKPGLDAKSIQFENRLSSPAIYKTDPNLISLIIHNLIEYILSNTSKEGAIVIEAEKQSGELTFRISASRLKVSEEDRETLFNMESSLIKAGNAAERATGLGLVLCKDFLEKAGSSIHLETDKSTFAAFCFSIPLADVSVNPK